MLDGNSEQVRTREGKQVSLENKFQTCESYRSKQMPYTDQIADSTTVYNPRTSIYIYIAKNCQ